MHLSRAPGSYCQQRSPSLASALPASSPRFSPRLQARRPPRGIVTRGGHVLPAALPHRVRTGPAAPGRRARTWPSQRGRQRSARGSVLEAGPGRRGRVGAWRPGRGGGVRDTPPPHRPATPRGGASFPRPGWVFIVPPRVRFTAPPRVGARQPPPTREVRGVSLAGRQVRGASKHRRTGGSARPFPRPSVHPHLCQALGAEQRRDTARRPVRSTLDS